MLHRVRNLILSLLVQRFSLGSECPWRPSVLGDAAFTARGARALFGIALGMDGLL